MNHEIPECRGCLWLTAQQGTLMLQLKRFLSAKNDQQSGAVLSGILEEMEEGCESEQICSHFFAFQTKQGCTLATVDFK